MVIHAVGVLGKHSPVSGAGQPGGPQGPSSALPAPAGIQPCSLCRGAPGRQPHWPAVSPPRQGSPLQKGPIRSLACEGPCPSESSLSSAAPDPRVHPQHHPPRVGALSECGVGREGDSARALILLNLVSEPQQEAGPEGHWGAEREPPTCWRKPGTLYPCYLDGGPWGQHHRHRPDLIGDAGFQPYPGPEEPGRALEQDARVV